MAKYRTNKIKHEHQIISGIRPLLERIAECPAVQAIIPGVINPNRSARGTELTYQYRTDTGLRLLARSQGAIQEVFVVTADAAGVSDWLHTGGLVAGQPTTPAVEPPPLPLREETGRQVVVQFEHRCAVCGQPIRAGARAWRPQPERFMHLRCRSRSESV